MTLRTLCIWLLLASAAFAADPDHRYPMQSDLVDAIGDVDGTFNGGSITTVAGPGGELTSAIDFDSGSSQYVSFASAFSLDENSDWTVFIRVKAGSGSATCVGSATLANSLLGQAGGTRAYFADFDTFLATTGGIDTSWHSYMICNDASEDEVKIFRDGVAASNNPYTTNAGDDFNFQYIARTGGLYHNGPACDLRVWLSSDESSNALSIHNDTTLPSSGNVIRLLLINNARRRR